MSFVFMGNKIVGSDWLVIIMLLIVGENKGVSLDVVVVSVIDVVE